MQCKVILKSCGDGWTDEVKSEGSFTSDGFAYVINYKISNDDCSIRISNGGAHQQRRGDTNVDISFCQGKQTQCNISSGGFCGSYAVFTQKLDYALKKGGFHLSLVYLNGDEGEKITLSLNAIFITQEKL